MRVVKHVTKALSVLFGLSVATAALATAHAAVPDGSIARNAPAKSARVLIMIADGFDYAEYSQPYTALTNAGHTVTVAAPVKGVEIMPHMGKKGATAQLTLDEVDVNQFDAFVLPGGLGPGNLEKFPRALEICRQFMSSGKIVGTLCHGPRLLMRAGLLKDRTFTCLNTVADELADEWAAKSYGTFVDSPLVVDGNLITSRHPPDLPEFCPALLQALSGVKPASVTAASGHLPKLPGRAVVIALRQGFDDGVVAALMAAYPDAKVAGPAKGAVTGQNGAKVNAALDYADSSPLAAKPVIICPGGMWPVKRADVQQAVQPAWMDKQAAADQQRVDWLLARRQEGATLVLVGLDSWRLALLEPFKGKEFAMPDPARWTLKVNGKLNAKYKEAKAVRTDERVITTKGLATLAEALTLAAETDQ